jgi:nickel transport protein
MKIRSAMTTSVGTRGFSTNGTRNLTRAFQSIPFLAVRFLGRWYRIPAIIALVTMMSASQALAHHVVVFATVKGKTIEGEVFYQGGSAAAQVPVTILGTGNQKLGETETDETGKFSFAPSVRCDMRFVADAGMGHRGEYLLKQEELPPDLPPADTSAGSSGGDTMPGDTPLAHDHSASDHEHPHPHTHPDEADHVHDVPVTTEDIGRQVMMIRQDLNQLQQKLRFQDILGGIGYIVGIMGVWAYLSNRAKRA